MSLNQMMELYEWNFIGPNITVFTGSKLDQRVSEDGKIIVLELSTSYVLENTGQNHHQD
jgi:hypothetical protein